METKKKSDHCRVKCVKDFNVNYVSSNTGADEPNSKPARGKSSCLTMLSVKVKFLICLQINFRAFTAVFLIFLKTQGYECSFK